MNKKYQVFVSSTYKDLKEERSGVITAVLGIGCIPVAMEQFPAAPVSQWEYIKNMIDESDYIVLIVAGCYGTEDRIEKISFTEKEFNYAKEIGKPVLPFLIQNPESLSVSKSENSDSKKKKLQDFREKIEDSGCLVNYYTNVDDLKYKVAASVTACISNNPGVGWVRADQVEKIVENLKQSKTVDTGDIMPMYKIASEEDIKRMFDK